MKGILYEVYTYHPAIDFVGYLQSDDGSYEFLVCLQLSLSCYANHNEKLSDVLCHAPKKCYLVPEEPCNINMLQFYSSRAAHLYPEGKPSVLFLYISPFESERLLPDLQAEMMTKLNQYSFSFDIYVGTAPKDSIEFFCPYLH